MSRRTGWSLVVIVFLAFAAIVAGGLYAYIRSGGLRASQKPSAAETRVARWAVRLSVPTSAKSMSLPQSMKGSTSDLALGRDLYKEKCEVCHAHDGGGNTQAGTGLYPPPIDLRGVDVKNATDGELFYFIRYGIRNTAMPGWQLPDQDTWRLVAYIRNLPKVATLAPHPVSLSASASYMGSASCKSCHGEIYQRWQKTRMANVVRDPREHPDAVIPDLSKPDPLVTFSKDDIALVYGSKWKQRYLRKVGDDYFPFPAQWDITNKIWRPYNVKPGTDWWTPYYPPDNMHRPTGPTCDGCHSVNYDAATKKVTEWNVGCERCHGTGSDHVKNPTAENIVNPATLNFTDAADTCTQCHSQGQPLVSPRAGDAYDWPVGFQMGINSGSWKVTRSGRQLSLISPMEPRTRIECKETTLCRA